MVVALGSDATPGTVRAAGVSSLLGVVCPTSATCIAVGLLESGSDVSDASGAWSATLARHPSSWAGTAVPSEGISCPSTTVGYMTADDAIITAEGALGVPAMIEVSASGVAQPPRRLSNRSGRVSGISCVAVGTCTVVGQDNATAQGQSFHITGGVLSEWVLWANSNYMSGVSCTTAQSCGLAGSMPLYGVFGWRGPVV